MWDLCSSERCGYVFAMQFFFCRSTPQVLYSREVCHLRLPPNVCFYIEKAEICEGPTKPAMPASRGRVGRGLPIPNPYPYPYAPVVSTRTGSQTRDNPYQSSTVIATFSAHIASISHLPPDMLINNAPEGALSMATTSVGRKSFIYYY